MAEERERGGSARLRSFALGSVLGASAALATARRRRRTPGSPPAPAGLAAFESAPCYRELAERDGETAAAPPRAVKTASPPA